MSVFENQIFTLNAIENMLGVSLLYRLQSDYITNRISRGLEIGKRREWGMGWGGGVGGCGFSLSQFNNELRLSGPGQPWGDPSEKD